MGLYRVLISCLSLSFAVFGTVTPSAAADLTIGIGADVTAIDPHYHNVTPNNNVAAHIFDYLVLRDERQRPIPGLAESWKTVDPLTWEFKLRRGVKFHDGSDFTAADVVASIERVPEVPNSPSPFTAYTKQIKEMTVVDPYTIRFKTATPYPLMPTDMTQVAIVSKSAAKATTEDFNSGKAAVGTGPYKLVRYSKGDRIELARHEAYWGGKTPWEKVTLRLLAQRCITGRRAAGGRRAGDRICSDVRRRQNSRRQAPECLQGHRRPADLSAHGQRPRPYAVCFRQGRSAAGQESAQGSAGAEGLVQGDQQNGDRRQGHGGRSCRVGPIAGRRDVRNDQEPEGRAVRSRGCEEAARRGGLSRRIQPDHSLAEQSLRQRCQDCTGRRANADPSRYCDPSRSDAIGDFFPQATDLKFSFMVLGWSSGTGEASSPLKALLATYNKDKGFGTANRGRYSNPRVDALLEEALATVDDPKREALLQRATELAINDTGIIPLHFQVNLWATRNGITYLPRTDENTLAHKFRPAAGK